jgi:hypothetical protein
VIHVVLQGGWGPLRTARGDRTAVVHHAEYQGVNDGFSDGSASRLTPVPYGATDGMLMGS